MFDRLIVEDVLDDTIVCRSAKGEQVSLDTEGIIAQFEVGDIIQYVEQGFYEVSRNDEVVGGVSNLFTRLIQ